MSLHETSSVILGSGEGTGSGLAVSGNYAYIVTQTNPAILVIVDISNPALPVRVGAVTLNAGEAWGYAVAVDGNYAYVVCGVSPTRVVAVDVSNPAAPVRVSAVTFNTNEDYGFCIAISGTYAYISTMTFPAKVISVNISNPLAISRTGAVTLASGENGGYGIAISGNYAYIVTDTNLAKFVSVDITNPAAMVRAGGTNLRNTGVNPCRNIVISGTVAYVTTNTSPAELITVDISTPTAPSRIEWINLDPGEDRGLGLTISGNVVYITTNTTPIIVVSVDVTDPAAPFIIESLSLVAGSQGHSGIILGTNVYVVDEGSVPTVLIVVDTTYVPPPPTPSYLKLDDPDVLPPDNSFGVGMSSDRTYLAVAHASSPYVTIYKRNGDVFSKLADPDVLPAGESYGAALSSDGTYMAVAHYSSPYVTIYKRTGDVFSKLADPDVLPPSYCNGVGMSSDGVYLAVVSGASPYVTIYKRTGDVFSKLDDPDVLPTGESYGTALSSDGTYLAVAHTVSPYVTIYKRTGDVFSKLADPDVLPPDECYGAGMSSAGVYLAVTPTASPYVTIYQRTGDVFSKLADPDILPPSYTYGAALSSDGTYLAVSHENSPYVTIYKRTGDVFSKLADPDVLPTGTGYGAALSSSGTYLAVAHNSSPYITIYKSAAPGTYTLTIDITGSGSVTKDPDQASYDPDTLVTLEAFPDSQWAFDHWEGDLTGSDNPKDITMDSDKNVTAVFITYYLTVNISGHGSVTKDPDQDSYAPGDIVQLTAVPDSRWAFDHWEGDLTGSENPKNITMDGDKSVTAVFTPTVQYTLTTHIVPYGSITKNPNKPIYDPGDVVQLTAVPPNPGWGFDHWSGDLSGSDNPKNITMDGNKDITATFIYYELAINIVGHGSVSKTPDRVHYAPGTVVTLAATPDTGWFFASWGGDLSGSDNPKNITMDGDKTATATFTTSPGKCYILCKKNSMGTYGRVISTAFSYAGAHNASVAQELSYWTKYIVQNAKNAGGTYFVSRTGLYFDLTDIPDIDGITLAQIKLALRHWDNTWPNSKAWNLCAVSGDDLDDPLALSDFGQLLDETDIYGSTVIEAYVFPSAYYRTIELDEDGIADIVKGMTKFALRNSNDIANNPPSGGGTPNEYAYLQTEGIGGITRGLPTTNITQVSATIHSMIDTSNWVGDYVRSPFLYIEKTGGGVWSNLDARFRYRKTGTTEWTYTAWRKNIGWDIDIFTDIAGLKAATNYQCQMIMTDGIETFYGHDFIFTTLGGSILNKSFGFIIG